MAQIKKQGLLNLLINYLGFGIGGINYILLMPFYFATYEIGLIRLLISLANVWVSLGRLGTHVTFVRFLAHYRTEDRKHSGFVHWMYLLGFTGMAGFTLLYILGKPLIYNYFVDRSALFANKYYYTLIPFALSMLLFSMLETQASAIQRTVLSNFLREVAIRLLFLISILMFAANWLDLTIMIWLHIGAYGLMACLLAVDIARSGQFSWKGGPFDLPRSDRVELTRYSFLMMLTAGAQQLIQNLDSMMLGAMAGLNEVGVYGVYLSIALLVVLPERSLMRILFPVANEALQTENWQRVNELYSKSALIQLIAGLWIFGGIWINETGLYQFLKSEEYRNNFLIFVLLGLNYLINMGFGMNSYIILGTRHYRVETGLNVLLLILTILFNYLLIRAHGAIGAAGATLLSITLINLARWAYIRWHFKLSPFSWRNLAVSCWGGLLIVVSLQIPQQMAWHADLVLRSLAFSVLYFCPIIAFRISPDLNQTTLQIVKRTKRIISQLSA